MSCFETPCFPTELWQGQKLTAFPPIALTETVCCIASYISSLWQKTEINLAVVYIRKTDLCTGQTWHSAGSETGLGWAFELRLFCCGPQIPAGMSVMGLPAMIRAVGWWEYVGTWRAKAEGEQPQPAMLLGEWAFSGQLTLHLRSGQRPYPYLIFLAVASSGCLGQSRRTGISLGTVPQNIVPYSCLRVGLVETPRNRWMEEICLAFFHEYIQLFC